MRWFQGRWVSKALFNWTPLGFLFYFVIPMVDECTGRRYADEFRYLLIADVFAICFSAMVFGMANGWRMRGLAMRASFKGHDRWAYVYRRWMCVSGLIGTVGGVTFLAYAYIWLDF